MMIVSFHVFKKKKYRIPLHASPSLNELYPQKLVSSCATLKNKYHKNANVKIKHYTENTLIL